MSNACSCVDSFSRPVRIDHPPYPEDWAGDKPYQNVHQQDVDRLDNNEQNTLGDLSVVDLSQTSKKETENCSHPRVLHTILSLLTLLNFCVKRAYSPIHT